VIVTFWALVRLAKCLHQAVSVFYFPLTKEAANGERSTEAMAYEIKL
jgi:hypothetical protein